MSKITYNLSDLVSAEFVEQFNELVAKIQSCGNDKLVINEDFWVEEKALYELIADIHCTDANKTMTISRELFFKGDENVEHD